VAQPAISLFDQERRRGSPAIRFGGRSRRTSQLERAWHIDPDPKSTPRLGKLPRV